MLKKTIKYVDYNGKQREEDYYFNLNRTELVRMEADSDGGLPEKLQRIVKANDGNTILKTFEDIILSAYGIKSEDGRRFEKSPEISKAFSQTEAYNVLLEELTTDADAGAEFVKRIIEVKNATGAPAMNN